MEAEIERRLREASIEDRKFSVQLAIVMTAMFMAGGGLTIAFAAVFRLVSCHP